MKTKTETPAAEAIESQPTVVERIAAAEARVTELRAQRASLALAASKGDDKARVQLAEIAGKMSAAVAELDVLRDARSLETEQERAQAEADLRAAQYRNLEAAEALIPALDAATKNSADALQAARAAMLAAEEVGAAIREALWSVHEGDGGNISERPLPGIVSNMATGQLKGDDREFFLLDIQRRISNLRDDLDAGRLQYWHRKTPAAA